MVFSKFVPSQRIAVIRLVAPIGRLQLNSGKFEIFSNLMTEKGSLLRVLEENYALGVCVHSFSNHPLVQKADTSTLLYAQHRSSM